MLRFCFCLLTGLFLLSCTKRPVTPTRDSRRAIDTIFQKEILVLQPQIDSMCVQMQDSLYPLAVDSILNERRMEMEILVE
jgi:hypothetical protein